MKLDMYPLSQKKMFSSLGLHFRGPKYYLFAACVSLSLFSFISCGPKDESAGRKKLLEDRYELLEVMIPTERAVQTALKDSDPFLRGRGAYVAARHGYRELIPLIRVNSDDENWFVRYHSLAALHRLRDRDSLSIFLNALNDADSSVRFKALEAIADFGDSSVFNLLRKMLKDESNYVRAAAAYAMGKLKLVEAVPLLIPELSPPSVEVVRREAQIALKRITGQNFPPRPSYWEAWWHEQEKSDR